MIEPLGYGCSDNPTRPRTVDNIIEELHAALKALQLKHVWLMPHSIAGIYSLAYVNKYPEDIEGILAIDPSHPEQIDHFDTTSMVKRMFMMKKMGWQRLSKKEHHTSAYGYSIEDLEQMDMMKRWHTHDQAQKNEAELFRQNMNACKDMNYPENLPVCMMLSKDNVTHFENWWLTLHQQQLSHTNYGKLVILKGNHFLHFTQSSQIALLTEETIKEYKKDGFQ